MKTNFFKKFMMPLAIMVFGFGLAFSTASMQDGAVLADQQGYRFVSAQDPCHSTKVCGTVINPICKSGATTLWGKENEDDMVCPVTLYERL